VVRLGDPPGQAVLVATDDVERPVSRARVDDHVLQVRVALVEDGPDGPLDESSLVERRRDDRDLWGHRAASIRSTRRTAQTPAATGPEDRNGGAGVRKLAPRVRQAAHLGAVAAPGRTRFGGGLRPRLDRPARRRRELRADRARPRRGPGPGAAGAAPAPRPRSLDRRAR